MSKRWRRKAVFAAGAIVLIAGSNAHVHAYSEKTHQDVVDFAWEVMLASQDPALTTRRNVFGGVPGLPTSLRDVGFCDVQCGRAPGNFVTQAEWDAHLNAIRDAILNISRMSNDMPWSEGLDARNPSEPTFRCDMQFEGKTLGQLGDYRPGPNFAWFTSVHPGDYHGQPQCDRGPARQGIFDQIGVGPGIGLAGIFGDTRSQGLVLGWHAKAADDADHEYQVELSLGHAILNAPVAAGLSFNDIGKGAVAAVFLPFVCLGGWLTGQNCLDLIDEISDDLNPVAALQGIIPHDYLRIDVEETASRGFGHFIVAAASFAKHDDRSGIWYEWLPGLPGISDTDAALLLGADQTGLTISPDASNAIKQYDVGMAVEAGHPTRSGKRGSWYWGRDTFGHVQMTPLDQLALFGWRRFRDDSTKNVKNLRWPLHAFGDATVPMHVFGTTGHGHAPYEGAVGGNWKSIRHQIASSDGGDPLEKLQIDQARRILQSGFKVREKTIKWRGENNRPNDVPVQALVTDLALETVALVDADPRANEWLWCDKCSTTDALGTDSPRQDPDAIVQAKIDSVVTGREHGDSTAARLPYLGHAHRMRPYVESSVGYILGFLSMAAERPPQTPQCAETGQPCSGGRGAGCCNGVCNLATRTCDAPPKPRCQSGDRCDSCAADSECVSGRCVNAYCVGGTECMANGDCPDPRDGCFNGFCGSRCSSNAHCSGVDICENGLCCAKSSAAICIYDRDCCQGMVCAQSHCVALTCLSSAECRSGESCKDGSCRKNNGQPCINNAECYTGICDGGLCAAIVE